MKNGKKLKIENIWVLFALCLAIAFAACSSDDDNNGSEDPTPTPTEEEVTYDDLSYFQNAIIEVDTLGNFMSRVCGEVLYENEPHHLYVGVETLEEAQEMFDSWIAPDVEVQTTVTGMTAALTDAEGNAQGTVYFTAGTQSGHVAEVTASSGTKLLHFDKVTFLLNSAWPVNASAKIYHQGDVITHAIANKDISDALFYSDMSLKWICIRESGNGQKPMFITVTNNEYEVANPNTQWRYNNIRFSSYCPAESKAKAIVKILKNDWSYWLPKINAAGIPIKHDHNYWIDMDHYVFVFLYYDAIDIPTGITYGKQSYSYPFLLKIDWLDDSSIYSNLTATAGSSSHQFEGYERLFDGVNNTKWCSALMWKKDGIWFVEFSGNIALKPVGYKLTTASDTEKYPGRNPKAWRLLARNDEEGPWTEIAKETNGGLPAVNGYTKSYSIPNPKKYMYYRWEISECIDNNESMQVSCFSFVF